MSKDTKNLEAKCFFPYLNEKGFRYLVTYFKNGEFSDFGALERVEFEDEKIMGTIEIWSSGWIGLDLIFLPDVKEVLNLMLPPEKVRKEGVEFIIDEAIRKNENSC